MKKKSSMMRKLMVLMMALAVVVSYSVLPMNQTFAASAKKPAKVKSLKVKALNDSETSIQLKWKKAKKAKKYQVYRATKKKGKYKKVATVKKTTYVNKGLKDGKKYFYKVRAVNGKKKGKFSAVKSATARYVAPAAAAPAQAAQVSETDPTLGAVKERKMTTTIDMTDAKYDGSVVRVWIPVPQSSSEQTIGEPAFEAPAANANSGFKTESVNGNKLLYLEWDADAAAADRTATLTFTAKRHEVSRTNLQNNPNAAISDEAKAYIDKESSMVKVNDPIVKKYAAEAVQGVADKNNTLEKARAIYDWVIANLERIDNNETLECREGSTSGEASHQFKVVGCGYGNTVQILEDHEKYGRAGGHCTDINSTFVALCRANGIPAREMFGIRLSDNATGGQHCWAQFYLPGTGWVYADPGDVCKFGVKENKKDLNMTVAQLDEARKSALTKEKTEYYWGTVDNDRIELSRGRDVVLEPAQHGDPYNTFGYPCGEFVKDGEATRIECTDAANFKYSIGCDTEINYEDMDKDSEEWAALGIPYSELSYADDYVIDVRPADAYAAGHIVGSTNVDVQEDGADAKLKEEYQKAAGKRIVLICYQGKGLAGRGMQSLNKSGADMSKVTYLIGGANGLAGSDNAANLGVGYGDFDNANAEYKVDGSGDVIVDVRPAAQYNAAHIPGAVGVDVSDGISDEDGAKLTSLLESVPEGKKLVVVCVKGVGLAKNTFAYYQGAGKDMKNVTYLIGGATGVSDSDKASWIPTFFSLDVNSDTWKSYGMSKDNLDPEIDCVVDVRKAADFANGKIEGSINVPTDGTEIVKGSDAAKALEEAFEDAYGSSETVVLICYGGNVYAKRAMDYLYNTYPGINTNDVTFLIGGYNGWIAE